MIRSLDCATLALTKLRTRRIRLAVTVIVSTLIFCGLATASLVSNGIFHSLKSFSKEGFANRYVLLASPILTNIVDLSRDSTIIARATELQKNQIARKKVEAKKLGVAYDPLVDPSPVNTVDTPNGKEKYLDIGNPLARQAKGEYLQNNPPAGLADIQKQLAGYDTKAFYQSTMQSGIGGSDYSLKVLVKGKEDFTVANSASSYNPTQKGTDSFSSDWQLMSKELLAPFLLPGQNLAVDEKGNLPIIAPYSAVEQLLGLQALGAGAGPKQKLDRVKEVRAKAANLQFSVCYRNQSSNKQITDTVTTSQDIEKNKKNAEYQKPSLIYALPKQACGPIAIQSDKRTAEEKTLATNEQKFRELFGEPAPTSTTLSFRIVGLAPDTAEGTSSLGSLMGTFLSSNLGMASWFTPIEARDKQPLLETIFPAKQVDEFQPTNYYVEFASAKVARSVIKNEYCKLDNPGVMDEASIEKQNKALVACVKAGNIFEYRAFGSSSLALDDAKQGFAKVFSIVAAVVTLFAAIIMIGTVGRVIADSRRETAVFRAIGATRFAIAQIYLTYTVFLSLLVATATLLGGAVTASIINNHYSSKLTLEALVAFNAADLTRRFSLFGVNALQLIIIVGLVLVSGLLSAVIPLLSNIRRNPMRDMRDEN